MSHPDKVIYKILTDEQWQQFDAAKIFTGAPIDLLDGYIHFSTASQARETAAKHFSDQKNLKLVSVSTKEMGEELKYEVSRGNALFPHLYSDLKMESVLEVFDLSIGADGNHCFPENM